MALVTQKERVRRVLTVVFCGLASIVAIFTGVDSIKQIDNLESKSLESCENLRKNQRDFEGQIQQIREVMVDFSKPIGWQATKNSLLDHVRLRNFITTLIQDLKKVEGLKDKFNESMTLKDLIEQLVKTADDYRSQSTQLDRELQSKTEEATNILNSMREADTNVKNDLQRAIDEYIRILQTLRTLQSSHNQELAHKEKIVHDYRQDLEESRKKNRAVITELESKEEEIEERTRIITMKQGEAQLRREEDGQIIQVIDDQNLVYINLTRKDKLLKGMKFKVFGIEKGGARLEKGEIDVFELGDDFSKGVIIKLIDPKIPIKENDRIYNELYNKDKPNYIAIAGTPSRYSKDHLSKLIDRKGDVYQTKVDEKTSLVFVAKDYQKDPNYNLAVSVGVRILTESYLYSYLNITD